MGLRTNITHGKEQIKRGRDVISLHKHCMVNINHRIRCRRAFTKMDDCLGLKLGEDFLHKTIFSKVTLPKPQLLSKASIEGSQPIFNTSDGYRTPGFHLIYPPPTEETVCTGYLMTPRHQMLRQGPSKIPV